MIRTAIQLPYMDLRNPQSWGERLLQALDNRDREISSEINSVLTTGISDLVTRTGRYINVVDDYGADPTGTTDSTTAIQNAITNNPGRVIWFPRGEYLTGPLAIKTPGTSLVGEVFGAKVFGAYAAGELGVALKYNGTSGGTMLRVHTETTSQDVSGILVTGIHFNGNSTAGIGIKTESCVSSRLERFKISGCTSIGLHVTGDDDNGTYTFPYGALCNTYDVSFRDFYIVATGSAVAMKIGALYGENDKREHIAFSQFEQFHLTIANGVGVDLANADDVRFHHGSIAMTQDGTGIPFVVRCVDYGQVYNITIHDILTGWTPGSLNISSVTTNSKNELRIVTTAAHGRSTGNSIDITRAMGIMGLNGRHTVTVIDSTTMDLDGTYYVKGTAVAHENWTYLGKVEAVAPRWTFEGTETGRTKPPTGIKVRMRGGDHSSLLHIGTGAQVHYKKLSMGITRDFYHDTFSRLRFDPGSNGTNDDHSNMPEDPFMLDWYEESEHKYLPALVDSTNARTSIEGVSNSSGLIKIYKTGHGLLTGDKVWVSEVGGVPQSRGYWAITRIDDDYFTLNSSFWCSKFAYTSGGKFVQCAVTNTASYMEWTRIGDRVLFSCRLLVLTSGVGDLNASSNLAIRGLPPFEIDTDSDDRACSLTFGGLLLSSPFTCAGAVVDNANVDNDGPKIVIMKQGNDTAPTTIQKGDLSTTVSFNVYITGHYKVKGTILSDFRIHQRTEF